MKTRTENLKWETDRCRRTQPKVSYPLRCFASIVIYDNLNRLRELEEGGRRVKFVDYVRSGDKYDELEKNVASYTKHANML